MGLFDRELEPGHEGLKPCPECGKREVGRSYSVDSTGAEYYFDAPGLGY